MTKRNYRQENEDFETRVLRNDEFIKWGKEQGFDAYGLEAPMLYQFYSRYLASKTPAKKTVAKTAAKTAPRKVVKPAEIKHTRDIKTGNFAKR